jgi:hypothetical protein
MLEPSRTQQTIERETSRGRRRTVFTPGVRPNDTAAKRPESWLSLAQTSNGVEIEPYHSTHSRRTEVEDDEQCTCTTMATNAPAATRPVCWHSCSTQRTRLRLQTRCTWPFIGSATQHPSYFTPADSAPTHARSW